MLAILSTVSGNTDRRSRPTNNILTTDAAHFICVVQLISRTYDSGQLQILTNFTNAPFKTKKVNVWCAVCSRQVTAFCFLEEEDGQANTVTLCYYDQLISSPKASTKP